MCCWYQSKKTLVHPGLYQNVPPNRCKEYVNTNNKRTTTVRNYIPSKFIPNRFCKAQKYKYIHTKSSQFTPDILHLPNSKPIHRIFSFFSNDKFPWFSLMSLSNSKLHFNFYLKSQFLILANEILHVHSNFGYLVWF